MIESKVKSEASSQQEASPRKEAELYKRIYQQSKEKPWDVITEARDAFFSMKKTTHVPSWVAEWFVTYFGSKPIEEVST